MAEKTHSAHDESLYAVPLPSAESPGRPPARRSLRLLAVLAIVTAVALISAWVGARYFGAGAASSTLDEPSSDLITAEVERRILTDTQLLTGEVVVPTTTINVPAVAQGNRSVLTSPAMAPGDQVVEGDAVAFVANRPVIVLNADLPMYRTVYPGDRGPDVSALQQSLERLRLFRWEYTDGWYDWATEQAVIELYRSVGAESLEGAATGGRSGPIVTPDEIVFLNDLPATVTSPQEGPNLVLADPLIELSAGTPEIRVALTQPQTSELASHIAAPSDAVTMTASIGGEDFETRLVDITESASSPGSVEPLMFPGFGGVGIFESGVL